MMTPSRLFFARWKRNGKEQLRAWNSVFDWSVWIYLLIPGLVIFGGLYRELWGKMPDWALQMPWTSLYPVVLFIVLAIGRIRIFVEEADRLFLLQRPAWIQALKRWGIAFSFTKQALVLLLPFGLLLPFLLIAEGMEWLEIGSAYLYTFVFGMSMSLASHLMLGKARGWRKWVLDIIVLIVLAAAYLYPMLALSSTPAAFELAVIAIMLIFLVLLVLVLRTGIQFEAEVKQDRDARMRSTEFLMSQVIESKPRVRLKRPILFRRSQRIFRKCDAGTMLAEMRLKALVRRLTMLRIWLSFISISSYALTLVPASASFLVIVLLVFLGASWLRMQWQHWFAEEFIAQFPWSALDVKRAITLSRFWLLLPPLVLWLTVACVRFFVFG